MKSTASEPGLMNFRVRMFVKSAVKGTKENLWTELTYNSIIVVKYIAPLKPCFVKFAVSCILFNGYITGAFEALTFQKKVN